ncbi:YbjN domain-containing protein [Thermus thermophilus]|uniref:YbjN domain-containing protein n=1 Tax=Thermus thermophilus TaxID=274 RepID=UPI0003A241E1|nr:YbjN domain-containing protein [Thermus thermophilus]
MNLTGATLDYKDGRRRTRTPALSLPPTLCPGSQQGVLKLSGSPGACLRSKLFSRAYLDEDGDPVLEADLDLEGGVTNGAIRALLENFRDSMREFIGWIGF